MFELDGGIGEQLASWGKVLVLETRGRRSGELRRVAIGFVTEPTGTVLVAAGSHATGWARNLAAHPRCTLEIDGVRRPYTARPLDGSERARSVRELILKYGGPAERLGRGPAFALVPEDGVDPFR